MPTFKVIKTFIYSEELDVEAETAAEAHEKGLAADYFDKLHGDLLQSCEVRELPA